MTNMFSIITAIHLAALSQVESRDRDDAVGAAGEVSRYQIMPLTIEKEAALNPAGRGIIFRGKWCLKER